MVFPGPGPNGPNGSGIRSHIGDFRFDIYLITPSKEAQTIMPDEEYNCLSQVTVKAIPYVETDNSAGGKTVTIG